MAEDQDPLALVPPEGIPGVLFQAFAERLYDHYPASKRKAERVAINLLEMLIAHYEAVEGAES